MDPKLANDYATLKLQLAQQHRDDIAAFSHGKTGFIAGVLAAAGIEVRPK